MMIRVFKLALVALLAYAIATATPTQQLAVMQGARAVGEAAFDACTREGSPCQRAIALLQSASSRIRNDHAKTSPGWTIADVPQPSSHPSPSLLAPASQKRPAPPRQP
jgi:hypothetical protein